MLIEEWVPLKFLSDIICQRSILLDIYVGTGEREREKNIHIYVSFAPALFSVLLFFTG